MVTATKLEVVATTIMPGEKAYSLAELNEQSPGGHGFHRYQIIQVNRGDKLATYRWDMGPVANFQGVHQIRIPSLFVYTVDELKGMATELRNEVKLDIKDFLSLDKMKLV